jgi:hypothetical protein
LSTLLSLILQRNRTTSRPFGSSSGSGTSGWIAASIKALEVLKKNRAFMWELEENPIMNVVETEKHH